MPRRRKKTCATVKTTASTPCPDVVGSGSSHASSSTAPSKVWRICQGEPVNEDNTGRLAHDFGRLCAFMDRHVFQSFVARAERVPAEAETPRTAGNGR
jgi:hypothetical protein